MIEDDYRWPQLHRMHNLQVIVVNHANNNMKKKELWLVGKNMQT
jgi:hypothetical protein